jgi:hypothetical protein
MRARSLASFLKIESGSITGIANYGKPLHGSLQAWLRALRRRVAVCRYEIEWAMNEICLKFIHFGERVAV